MIRVCSGFSESGYVEYGKAFLDSFHKFWPSSVNLQVFTETPVDVPRGTCRSLWECRGAADFLARHKDDPSANGRKPDHRWSEKYRQRGYNYKFDACKWFRQCLIPDAAIEGMADGDVLVWLDADVLTFSTVPQVFVERLIGECDLAFLGRRNMHSEIGFWAVRVNSRSRLFVKMFADLWRTDLIFNLPEWHSAAVFDYCRRKAAIAENNLTPNGSGHVFDTQSPLRHYMSHLKGERKALGYSPEHRK